MAARGASQTARALMTFHDPHLASGADSGRTIVEALGGHWTPRGGMCRCPAHADATPSLSVRPGRRRLLFHCFAGCETRDVLDAIAALRLPGGARVVSGTDEPIDTRKPAVERLWSEARPLRESPASRYLAGRGLIGTSALRFHPRTPQGRQPLTRFLPAMIAAVTDETGLVAVHRTFLSRDGLSLSSRQPARAALGSLGSGLVRLVSASNRLGLAEGIETALSPPSDSLACPAGPRSEPNASSGSLFPRRSRRSSCFSTMMPPGTKPRRWRASASPAGESRPATRPSPVRTGTMSCAHLRGAG